MKSPLSPLISFLLVALMFPGPYRTRNINHQGMEGPREPWEESPGQGKNESYLLHLREKRRLLPRTPPYLEPEPDFKIVNCKKSEGYCQEYCNYMETQVGYCFKKKYACCLHQNVLV